MAVDMPNVVVLIVCKTILVGAPDANSQFTGWENREWAYENSMMVCQRHEVQMYDSAEAQGADPQSFSPQRCMASAIRLGTDWDMSHKSSAYRTWRVACPTPMIDTQTGQVVGWVLPDCGHRDTVRCETDSVI